MSYFRVSLSVKILIPASLAILLSTCAPQRRSEPAEYRTATRIALDWNRLLLELEWHTPGYRPPVSARMFAYLEMAAYEAALPAMNDFVSLENTFPTYRKVEQSDEHYYLPAALNAAFAQMAGNFFPTAPNNLKEKIKKLEAKYAQLNAANTDPVSLKTSIGFGKNTANAVWRYSIADSIGHDAFMYNFDRNFKVNDCRGCWKSEDERPMPPLLPNWGHVRSFIVNTSDVTARAPARFEETAPSAYFSEAMEVFSISQSLRSEDHWISEFWSDDLPGLTITPTGRWISITNQAIDNSELSFPEVMETYLKTAFALCDAAIICWNTKYEYQVERPESFIRRNIQSDWAPLHPSPPFPSYPSGHAIFGAAAAEILTSALGPDFSLIDRSHQGRQEFAGKPRSFHSFEEMANENAYSRVLIGVHFRMDCEEGLRLGKLIGQKIAATSLRKEQVAIIRVK